MENPLLAHRLEIITKSPQSPSKDIVGFELLANIVEDNGKIIYPPQALDRQYFSEKERYKFYAQQIKKLSKEGSRKMQYQVNCTAKELMQYNLQLFNNFPAGTVLEINENIISQFQTISQFQGFFKFIKKDLRNDILLSLDDLDDGLRVLIEKGSNIEEDTLSFLLDEVDQIKLSVLGFEALPKNIKEIIDYNKDKFQIVFEQLTPNPTDIPDGVTMEQRINKMNNQFTNAYWQHWDPNPKIYR